MLIIIYQYYILDLMLFNKPLIAALKSTFLSFQRHFVVVEETRDRDYKLETGESGGWSL